MADIIDIRRQREKRKATKGQPTDRGDWLFRLDVYRPEPGTEGFVGSIVSWDEAPDGLEVADRLRRFASALEDLARTMRMNAHGMQPDADGEVLAGCMVWESSKVRIWLDTERMTTPEQLEWLDRRLDEAKAEARGLVKEKSGG